MTAQTSTDFQRALIVGAGQGLSGSLARRFSAAGMKIALAARNVDKLEALCGETGARAFTCDAADAGSVDALFRSVEDSIGAPDVVVYNASGRLRGAIEALAPDAVAQAISVSAFGGFLVGQQAA